MTKTSARKQARKAKVVNKVKNNGKKKTRKGFSSPPHMGPNSKKAPKKGIEFDDDKSLLNVGSLKVRSGYIGSAPANPRRDTGKTTSKQPSRAL